MGKIYDGIDEKLAAFIGVQKMFFTATAPIGHEGRVNLSPKGGDTFRVLGPHTVAYLDWTGSGVETIAHLRENGRITFLFCAFEGPPKILRLYGHGEAIEPGDAEWDTLSRAFPEVSAPRAIVRAQIERIADACGYGIPLYAYEGERTQAEAWARAKGPEGLVQYRAEKNAQSIDGLPGLRRL